MTRQLVYTVSSNPLLSISTCTTRSLNHLYDTYRLRRNMQVAVCCWRGKARGQTAYACNHLSNIPALCSSPFVTICNPNSLLEKVGGEVGGVAWSDLVIPPTPVKAVRKRLSSYAILADYQAHVYRPTWFSIWWLWDYGHRPRGWRRGWHASGKRFEIYTFKPSLSVSHDFSNVLTGINTGVPPDLFSFIHLPLFCVLIYSTS